MNLALLFSAPAHGEKIAEGVTLVPLTQDGLSSAVAWAYHGSKVAFVRETSQTQSRLMVMNSDGTDQVAVTEIGLPFFAEWSWKGDRISYEYANAPQDESQGGIYIHDLESNDRLSVSAPYTLSSFDEDDGPLWSADDRHVVYQVKVGPSQKRQLWVADTESGQLERLLPTLGEGRETRWSPLVPPRISLQIQAAGDMFDVATVDPDGRNFIRLTDVGAQSIRNRRPRWSPTGEWIAYADNVDMTQSERDSGRYDVWIARPDGSERRNLTNATSPATEKQLAVYSVFWSWDGRWILGEAARYDIQGNFIPALYLIDPVNGGYETIYTSDPRETGEIAHHRSMVWSYDGTKIAILTERFTVRDWGPDREYENGRTALSLYDVRERKLYDLIEFENRLDRKMLLGETDRDEIAEVSWSPDNRSLLVTISQIISEEEEIDQPDVYRLDLPERFISEIAHLHNGPPMGRADSLLAVGTAPATAVAPAAAADLLPAAPRAGSDVVTQLIQPQNMTVTEALSFLPSSYSQYVTDNTARNSLLFKGPRDVLEDLQADLALIDTPSPHVLVDLLAVELTDEANRSLGLDWTYAKGSFGMYQPSGSAIRDLTPDERLNGLITYPGVGQLFYDGVGSLPKEFFVRLNTLVRDGQGTILANPRTVSESGKESKINIRTTLNFFFNEGFDTAGRPIVKKSDISSETMGRITPTLLPNGQIHLVVDVGVGSFTFTQEQGLPEQTSRQSTTEVTVQDGETIIIGGLRQQVENRSEAKVPFLGDIPWIGLLFRNEVVAVRHTVLTIFITPRLMKPDEPIPDWPVVNPEDHQQVPIMETRVHVPFEDGVDTEKD